MKAFKQYFPVVLFLLINNHKLPTLTKLKGVICFVNVFLVLLLLLLLLRIFSFVRNNAVARICRMNAKLDVFLTCKLRRQRKFALD